MGKFPKGIEFSSGKLVYKKNRRTKPHTYFIPDDVEAATAMIKEIFRKYTGLLSSNDLMRQRVAEKKKIKEITYGEETTWRDIRAPTTKLLLINMYVWQQQKRLNLTEAEADSLFTCIYANLLLNVIGSNEIKLEKGEIASVEGVTRLPNGHFTIKMPKCTKGVSYAASKKIDVPVKLEDNYDSYLNTLDARTASSSL